MDFRSDLAALEAAGQLRELRPLASAQGRVVRLRDVELVNFSSNDYLGLAAHPALVEAARSALDQYGHGAGAARLLAGNFDVAAEIEQELVDWLGCESALLFSSGYHANLAVLPTLYRSGTVHSDELNHASLIDGIRLSGAPKEIHPHLQLPAVVPRGDWVVTESVFSMDGDGPDPAMLAAQIDAGANVFVDEAHAIGVSGEAGRGHAPPHCIRVGTFGKALGSYGAFVAGPSTAIRLLLNRARTFMFTTGLPASVLAATLAGLRLARGEQGDERRARLRANNEQFRDAANVSLNGSGPIFSVPLGTEQKALAVSAALERDGLLVQPIRPPTVPASGSRLRVVITASHEEADIARLANSLQNAMSQPD